MYFERTYSLDVSTLHDRYIINPDSVHHLYLLDFKMAYPNAKVIGVEDTVKRMNEKSFPFDGRECLVRASVVQRCELSPCY